EGAETPRHPRGHRRELRTDPSLEPRRNGNPSPAIHRYGHGEVARTHRRGNLRDRRTRFAQDRPDDHGEGDRLERKGEEHLRESPDRYAERTRVLPPWRNPPVRAARSSRGEVETAEVVDLHDLVIGYKIGQRGGTSPYRPH